MSKPWTLPGAVNSGWKSLREKAKERIRDNREKREMEEKVDERKTAAVDDFTTIKENLERIRKEQEEAQKNAPDPNKGSETQQQNDCYCDQIDYGCNGTEVTLETSSVDHYPGCGFVYIDTPLYPDGNSYYELMEGMLDENDALIAKYYPDPRIQELIKKYGLRIDNTSLQKYKNTNVLIYLIDKTKTY